MTMKYPILSFGVLSRSAEAASSVPRLRSRSECSAVVPRAATPQVLEAMSDILGVDYAARTSKVPEGDQSWDGWRGLVKLTKEGRLHFVDRCCLEALDRLCHISGVVYGTHDLRYIFYSLPPHGSRTNGVHLWSVTLADVAACACFSTTNHVSRAFPAPSDQPVGGIGLTI